MKPGDIALRCPEKFDPPAALWGHIAAMVKNMQ
jgi:hypothetical protein